MDFLPMTSFWMYLWLIIGFVFLVKGADIFVDGASALAKILHIPSLIIGLTIVAFGTSAPELAVSVTSAIQGKNGLSVGNVVGSNIFNVLMVAGCAALIAPLSVQRNLLKKDIRFTTIPNISEKINMLEETMNDTEYEIEYSKDKDAKVGHKTADTSFFGYKTHIAMTPERIITAATTATAKFTRTENSYTVSYEDGGKVDYTNKPTSVKYSDDALTINASAKSGYAITDVSVTMGGSALTLDEDYTWEDGELMIMPTNFTGELNDATITLGWEAAEGAASYNVYRSNTGTDYEIIANVTETQYEEEITENGDYYYQVTAVFADGESDPATTPEGDNVIMFNVSGLGIAENNVNVSLYPNPSDGAFNVSCPGMTKIMIYGLCGETVIDIDTKADSHVVSDLDAGVYFIRIETAKGSITQKIVRL